ncbi:MAG TPA: hypothetical protein DCE42_27320, partial [Myxococcales bacterium]|nr:hypothetical protein [Myxococcales bacterium]
RPQLASHNGDVELVSVEPPEVKIRLLGTCDGCALSTLTVKLGIEKAIKEAVESIEVVTIVKEGPARATSSPDKSPFEQHWEALCDVSEIPEEGIHVAESEKASVLLTLVKGEIKAYPNACTHLGMPLDTGSVKNGILTCAYHGFQYLLSSGECLTAPEIQLPRYPTKIEEGKVWVQLTD